MSDDFKPLANLLVDVITGVDLGPLSWTDEQWTAHGARIAERRAAEGQQDAALAAKKRRQEFTAAGFPLRAIEAAEEADLTKSAIARVREWAPGEESVLILSGSPGCGKTVAAVWWALQCKNPPTFIRATAFAASSRYDRETRDAWFESSALILDDLGTEYADTKGSFLVDLDELVDTFYGNRKPLLITTNCTAQVFKDRYGARIVDRLRECGSWFSVASGSLRRKP